MRRKSPYGPNPARITTVILLIAVIVVIIWFAASPSAENFFSEKIIAPLFGRDNTEEPIEATATIKPQQTDAAAANQPSSSAVRLEFQPFIMYGVQLGAFSVRENATAVANIINNMGAAGYVHEDEGLYRVLATVFYEEQDARDVVDNIKAVMQMDACLKLITIDGLTLDITADGEQVEAVQNAHNVWLNTSKAIARIDREFDSIKLTRGEFTNALNELVNDLESVRLNLEQYDTISPIITSLSNNLKKYENNISSLASSSKTDKEISSEIKYLLIDMVIGFGDYAKSVG